MLLMVLVGYIGPYVAMIKNIFDGIDWGKSEPISSATTQQHTRV
jgi:hypothetical protein